MPETPDTAAGQFHEDHERDMADPKYAKAFRDATDEVTTTAAGREWAENATTNPTKFACPDPAAHPRPEGCPVRECVYLVHSCRTRWHKARWRRALVWVASR